MITLMRDGSPAEIAVGIAVGGAIAALLWAGVVYGSLAGINRYRENREAKR